MSKSQDLFTAAQHIIPGGVNSPVRAFKQVAGKPLFFERSEGAYLIDVDNKRYVDYVCSWGAVILGHGNQHINEAIIAAMQKGYNCGAPSEVEIILAKLIIECIPSIEMVRMVSSGTEATLSAIRLARGYTKRNKIVKFTDCYHGHNDSLLVNSGSGLLTCGNPTSKGIPTDFIKHTLSVGFNDINAVKQVFANYGADIAAVIVEPIAANANLIMPNEDFLMTLRAICDQYNSLLIFDEVITGFRVDLAGAQHLYNVVPDLTCLGKIIGGGMPAAAFGGKKSIMENLAPCGQVYQAGTLAGHPIAMTAGIACLTELQRNLPYAKLQQASSYLMNGFKKAASDNDIQITTHAIGGLFGFKFLTDNDNKRFKLFFHKMLSEGIYLAPSCFESGFITTCHNQQILDYTIEKAAISFRYVREKSRYGIDQGATAQIQEQT